MKDHFEKKAAEWDKGEVRVNGAMVIAKAIESKFALTKEMKIMDFGAGTGLLGFEIAKRVKKVYGVDMSPSMLKKLEEKNTPDLNIQTVCQDIIKEPLKESFDGIVSSMTLHHVEHLESFFKSISKNLNQNGFIAIADLETEDGTFHSNNEGVFHFGFDKKELSKIVKNAGFEKICFEQINTIKKPHGDFKVFLLTAQI
jgi:predicted TPR repeat methyltransferase